MSRSLAAQEAAKYAAKEYPKEVRLDRPAADDSDARTGTGKHYVALFEGMDERVTRSSTSSIYGPGERQDERAEWARSACIVKIEEASRNRAWSGVVNERVRHFVAGTRTLILNRNLLMHSVVIAGPNNNSTLYRTGKRGDRQMVQATTDQIRAVADDLHLYFNFALALANCIAVKVDHADRQAGTIVFHDWPDEPPMPTPLVFVVM